MKNKYRLFIFIIFFSLFLISCKNNNQNQEESKWTVIFETNGGNIIESQVVENGFTITEISEPVKDGYTFVGWYLDFEYNIEVEILSYQINENTTFYAKWQEIEIIPTYIVISFETNGGNEIDSKTIEKGNKIILEDNPIKDGYEFDGWYLDENLSNSIDLNEYVFEVDTVLYGKWIKEEVVISDIEVIEYSGYLESAYIKWNHIKDAISYDVLYKKKTENNYTKLDMMLIRQYPDYIRADILGLAKGEYDIKIAAIYPNESGNYKELSVVVDNYDRSGFAFSNDSMFKTASGAYNDDGTLKNNAQVIYLTKNNAKTVTAKVNGTVHTGIQAILDAKQKANTSNDILCIRIIGMIKKEDLDYISSSSEGIQIKGRSAYTNMNITIEGVGDDATVYGFGFLVRNCGNVEFRNFAIMSFMDDGISLDTKNSNIWIHNMELYYGNSGSDSDQAKGDGSIDIKGTSTYITISYVHFVDSGKASLCGMSESEEFMVTYHHNWYDHSDSRHPRVRVGSVHVYNNYFDGVSKYGVGVTMGSSVFVESNYFNNTNYPMLSSKQGTDALGEGTFSGENGGIIKSYNNIIIGGKQVIYATQNPNSFDAYLATSRNELVPDTYKTLAGKTAYNNFDTSYDLGVSLSDIDDVSDVPEIVKTYAGRMNGGDFNWTFTDVDNSSYNVDVELKKAINSYKSSIVKIFGENESNNDSNEEDNGDNKEDDIIITDGIAHSFTTSGLTNDFFTISGNLSTSKGSVNYNDLSLTTCLKIESSTKISFNISKKMKLVLVFGGSTDANGKTIKINGTKYKIENNLLVIDLEPGSYEITKGDSINLFYISLD